MQCPTCHSDHVQKLSLIYEQGTQNIRTTGRSSGGGVGLGPGGLMVGRGGGTTRTKGKSQSIAAQKAAPPDKKKFALPLLVIIAGIFLLSYSPMLGMGVVAAGGFLSWKCFQYNSQSLPHLYAQWEKSWLCNKCGSVFTL